MRNLAAKFRKANLSWHPCRHWRAEEYSKWRVCMYMRCLGMMPAFHSVSHTSPLSCTSDIRVWDASSHTALMASAGICACQVVHALLSGLRCTCKNCLMPRVLVLKGFGCPPGIGLQKLLPMTGTQQSTVHCLVLVSCGVCGRGSKHPV